MAASASQRQCQCRTLRANLALAVLAALLCAAGWLTSVTRVDDRSPLSTSRQLSSSDWVEGMRIEPCTHTATAGSSDPALRHANQTSFPHENHGCADVCSAATAAPKSWGQSEKPWGAGAQQAALGALKATVTLSPATLSVVTALQHTKVNITAAHTSRAVAPHPGANTHRTFARQCCASVSCMQTHISTPRHHSSVSSSVSRIGHFSIR